MLKHLKGRASALKTSEAGIAPHRLWDAIEDVANGLVFLYLFLIAGE